MELSNKAKSDLRVLLSEQIGNEEVAAFSDAEINTLGNLLLTIFAESIMLQIAHPELSMTT